MNNNLLLTVGAAMATLVSCSPKKEQPKHPNIIYILADDMGYADLGCYGSKRIKTPNLDRMAEQGIRFTQHYAGTSVSAPSRCSLMTGLHTGHTQVRGNLQAKPYGQVSLKAGTQTIASCLKKAGYATALVGKWGMGVEGTEGEPTNHGFDYYCGYLCQVLAHNHAPEYLIENGKKIFLGNKVQYTDTSHWTKGLGSYPVEKKKHSQEVFTEKALNFIETNKANPFFLYYSVVIPHDNGEAPEGKRYSDMLFVAPYENEPWTESEKGYAAMITYLDAEIGKLMDKLKELGLDKNTLVIFTSDNGGNSPNGFKTESNYPYRGEKRDLYEGGIRVPHIAYWNGTIAPGRVSDHPSAFWDFLPTACEIAGVQPEQPFDGISYLPELLGKSQNKHDHLYFEFHEQGGKQAVIQGDWKCIRLNVSKTDKMTVELYNIKDDPQEKTDLASQHPEKVKELVALIDQNHTPNPVFKLLENVKN
jgi:arylsulfatase A-like enzyme